MIRIFDLMKFSFLILCLICRPKKLKKVSLVFFFWKYDKVYKIKFNRLLKYSNKLVFKQVSSKVPYSWVISFIHVYKYWFLSKLFTLAYFYISIYRSLSWKLSMFINYKVNMILTKTNTRSKLKTLFLLK